MKEHDTKISQASGAKSDALEETTSDAKAAARSMADNAKTMARETTEEAKARAVAQAENAKRGVAGEVSDVAGALRKAAEESRTGSPQERTFGQIAESLADVSDAISRKDLGEMAHDVSDFARRNPLVFLGGAALVGFAATRFAKAIRPQHDHTVPAQTAAGGVAPTPYSASGARDLPNGRTEPRNGGLA